MSEEKDVFFGKKVCSNCEFYSIDEAECRRRAPAPGLAHADGTYESRRFPAVMVFDWCGEFEVSTRQSRSDRPDGFMFARSMRIKRKVLGFTQAELAAAVGVTQAMITQYERGRARPMPAVVEKLRLVLRMPEAEPPLENR